MKVLAFIVAFATIGVLGVPLATLARDVEQGVTTVLDENGDGSGNLENDSGAAIVELADGVTNTLENTNLRFRDVGDGVTTILNEDGDGTGNAEDDTGVALDELADGAANTLENTGL